MKNFSNNWQIVTAEPTQSDILFVEVEDNNTLVITNPLSSTQKKITRTELVADTFKCRGEILQHLQKLVQTFDAQNFITPQAAKLVDEICEGNCMLF